MSKFKILRGALLTAAVFSVAACTTDGTAGIGGSGSGTTASPQLGITGSGGTTKTLGVASLTDPILGTTGLVGGGSSGLVGGVLPSSALAPLSSQLAPITNQIASALPLSTVADAVPGLGVSGPGGLTTDLIGQDPLTGVVGTDGLIAGVVGGGNDGVLGNIIPAGTVPTLPLPSTDSLTSLTSGTPIGGLTSGLTSSSNPVSTLTSTHPIDTDNPAGSLTNVAGLTNTLTTALSSTSPTDLVGTVTNLVNPSKLTGLTSTLTGN